VKPTDNTIPISNRESGIESGNTKINANGRGALFGLGAGLIASRLASSDPANSATEATLGPASARSLRDLSRALADTPRRRDFKTVPTILDKPDLWDEAALAAVLAHNGGPKLGQYRLGRSVAQRHAQFVELANLVVQRAQLPVRVRDVWFGSSCPLRSGYVGQVSSNQNWPAVILATIHL